MCLNEICSRVQAGRQALSDMFPIKNGMKQDDALLSMFPEDKPTRFETCTRHQKLNINSENCAFHWFVLYNYLGDQIKKNGMGRKCSMYGGGGFGVEI
jgi:hypothetical protein